MAYPDTGAIVDDVSAVFLAPVLPGSLLPGGGHSGNAVFSRVDTGYAATVVVETVARRVARGRIAGCRLDTHSRDER